MSLAYRLSPAAAGARRLSHESHLTPWAPKPSMVTLAPLHPLDRPSRLPYLLLAPPIAFGARGVRGDRGRRVIVRLGDRWCECWASPLAREAKVMVVKVRIVNFRSWTYICDEMTDTEFVSLRLIFIKYY